jgi:uncharacterized protein (DUF4213/DUF364 family)
VGLINQLLTQLPEGKIVDIRIGIHWTAVVVLVEGQRRCGLSSTLLGPHEHGGEPQVPQAGDLEKLSGRELSALALERQHSILASVGVASINALLSPFQPEEWIEGNAESAIAARGADKHVAIVGHFPFIPRLRTRVGKLSVLDRHPLDGEYAAEDAPSILPQADIVAITGMAIVNHTLEDLLKLCSSQALVMVLGPSTPLNPVLFGFGVDLLSGSVVTSIDPVLQAISQGANFRQIHQAGVRLVTVERTGGP